ncbi:hypothetical protein CRYUN_Cryun19dG0009800 [Craigia yunnanensis]
MGHRQAVSICTLKVNINCCTLCQLKVKEKLQKINGVEFVVYDSKGVMTVSGKVNPMTTVKKLEKWGRRAVPLSFRKSPKQDVKATGIDKSDHGSQTKMDKDCSCRCDSISDSDDDDDRDRDTDCEVPAVKPKKSNANITWQHPDLTINKQINTKSEGKKGFLGLFCRKGVAKEKLDGVTMSGKPLMVDEPSKWQFPRTTMPEYGSPRPYYRPFEPYPPLVIERPPAPPYHHFGLMRPPPPPLVPPPYGFFNSRLPPMVNPMIHYTSYADIYSHW